MWLFPTDAIPPPADDDDDDDLDGEIDVTQRWY